MDKKYLQRHREERVFFVKRNEIQKRTNMAFQKTYSLLVKILPGEDIQHVGATSIPGSLTKGDIDIQIRVDERSFAKTRKILQKYFKLDPENPLTIDYACFKDNKSKMSIGIQLTVKNSKYDDFYKIRDLLINDKKLLKKYNEIKKKYQGKFMTEYREEKEKFFEKIVKEK